MGFIRSKAPLEPSDQYPGSSVEPIHEIGQIALDKAFNCLRDITLIGQYSVDAGCLQARERALPHPASD